MTSADDPAIDAALCRAARAMVEWSQDQLAAAAGVTRQTIIGFERGLSMPWLRNQQAIRDALTAAGVRFVYTEHGIGCVLDRPSNRKARRARQNLTISQEAAADP